MSRRRIGLGLGGVLLLALLATELLLPGLAEREVESRLTEGGGTAEVTVEGFPALRLLFGDGSELSVEAEDLDLDVDELEGDAFDRLAGFDRIDVGLADSVVGPIVLEAFSLQRDGDQPYVLAAEGSTTTGELVEFGVGQLDGFAGALAEIAAGGAVDGGFADREVPFELDLAFTAEAGGIEVVSDASLIAGIPADALVEFLTEAVVQQL